MQYVNSAKYLTFVNKNLSPIIQEAKPGKTIAKQYHHNLNSQNIPGC